MTFVPSKPTTSDDFGNDKSTRPSICKKFRVRCSLTSSGVQGRRKAPKKVKKRQTKYRKNAEKKLIIKKIAIWRNLPSPRPGHNERSMRKPLTVPKFTFYTRSPDLKGNILNCCSHLNRPLWDSRSDLKCVTNFSSIMQIMRRWPKPLNGERISKHHV